MNDPQYLGDPCTRCKEPKYKCQCDTKTIDMFTTIKDARKSSTFFNVPNGLSKRARNRHH